MSLLTLEAASSGRLARRNPAAKLVAATLPALIAVATLDALTPAVIVAVTLLAVPWSGVGARTLFRRGRPLLLAAVAVGAINAVFTDRTGGSVLVDVGPVAVTSEAALVGLGIALRVVAVALPGVLVLASTDPVDLADSLVQQWRVPPRPAYGALAALRLLPLLSDEWRTIGLARRARGIDAGRNPVAALRLFASQVLALLVVAIRRGTRLATAMDARGFDTDVPRTHAREQRVTRADVLLVVAAAAVCALAVSAAVVIGTWDPLVG